MKWIQCSRCQPCAAGGLYYEHSSDGRWMIEGTMLFEATGNPQLPWNHIGDYFSRKSAKNAAARKARGKKGGAK